MSQKEIICTPVEVKRKELSFLEGNVTIGSKEFPWNLYRIEHTPDLKFRFLHSNDGGKTWVEEGQLCAIATSHWYLPALKAIIEATISICNK